MLKREEKMSKNINFYKKLSNGFLLQQKQKLDEAYLA